MGVCIEFRAFRVMPFTFVLWALGDRVGKELRLFGIKR